MPSQIIPTPEETPQENKVDWNLVKEKVQSKLDEIKKYLATFAGKPKHNPYLYWKHNVAPLEKRFKEGDISPELYSKILEFKLVPPTIDTFPDQNYKTTLDSVPNPFKEIQRDQAPIDPVKFMES